MTEQRQPVVTWHPNSISPAESLEIVPATLRWRLRWDGRHDAMAATSPLEFNLALPRDRELIRQLTVMRMARERRDQNLTNASLLGSRQW